jgi:hypothetical protein
VNDKCVQFTLGSTHWLTFNTAVRVVV